MTRPVESAGLRGEDDTAAEARQVQIERYRGMAPWEKITLALELERLADAFALAGLAARHPHADDEERRMRLLALKHGPELVRQAYGWTAGAAGA